MAKTDAELGKRVHEHLVSLNIENPIDFAAVKSFTVPSIEGAFGGVCAMLGLRKDHPSTEGTAHRLAKMYKNEICWGLDYDKFPYCMVGPNDGNFDEILVERNITIRSLCEHHFAPVMGFAHIAYMPKDKLLGLSKLNRVADFFAHRPQLQERLGQQILEALKFILETDDVAVIIRAEHFCVKWRGIQDTSSDTVTSHMSGRFRTDMLAKQELLTLIKGV